MTDQQKPGSSETLATAVIAPVADALGKAVGKLTSQIFVFLIAYLILVIFLTLSASKIAAEVRVVLVVLPILRLLVYAYLKRQKILAQSRDLEVQVRAGIATGGATVAGVRGTGPASLRSVKAEVGYAGGKATVVGVDNAAVSTDSKKDAEYLLQLFEQLNAKDRLELIGAANRMATKAMS